MDNMPKTAVSPGERGDHTKISEDSDENHNVIPEDLSNYGVPKDSHEQNESMARILRSASPRRA